MNRKIVLGIALLGIISLVASFASHLYFFLTAYLSESKTTLVNVNRFGEANLELVMLLVAVPCVVYVFLRFLDFLYKDFHKEPEVLKQKEEKHSEVSSGCDCVMCRGTK